MKEKIDTIIGYIEEENVLFESMLNNLTDEEMSRFLEDNPEFLKEL